MLHFVRDSKGSTCCQGMPGQFRLRPLLAPTIEVQGAAGGPLQSGVSRANTCTRRTNRNRRRRQCWNRRRLCPWGGRRDDSWQGKDDIFRYSPSPQSLPPGGNAQCPNETVRHGSPAPGSGSHGEGSPICSPHPPGDDSGAGRGFQEASFRSFVTDKGEGATGPRCRSIVSRRDWR